MVVPIVKHHADPAVPIGSASSVSEATLYCAIPGGRASPTDFCDLRARAPPSIKGFSKCALGLYPAMGWRLFQGLEHCLEACRPCEKPRIWILAGGIPPPPMVRLQNCGTGKRDETCIQNLKSAMFQPNLARDDNTGLVL